MFSNQFYIILDYMVFSETFLTKKIKNKKISIFLKLISYFEKQKIFCFHTYRRILKVFPSIPFYKKNKNAFFSCFEMQKWIS
jgi:hypothetical protein